MNIKRHRRTAIIAGLGIIATLCGGLSIPSIAIAAETTPTATAAADATSTANASPSIEDIKAYAKTLDLFDITDRNRAVEYESVPSLTNAGEVKDEYLQDALDVTNFVRYVAGLSPVSLDESLTDAAQAASVVSDANGEIRHEPAKPDGIDEDLFAVGFAAASKSNLAAGYSNPAASILGYMSDSDANNKEQVGHRRWILNPRMSKTGFGYSNTVKPSGYSGYSAMYVMDSSGTQMATNVAWPAQNQPIELFNSSDMWSISTGVKLGDVPITVTVTNDKTGESYTMSNQGGEDDGELYTNDEWSGQRGCIIFRPDAFTDADFKFSDGDTYTVHVDGTTTPIEYKVNFFAAYKQPQEISVASTSVKKTYGNAAFSLGAKAGEGSKLTYTSSDEGVAKVDADGNVTIVGAGKADITINASETAAFEPATKTVSIDVAKGELYIAAKDVTTTVGDDGFKLEANVDGVAYDDEVEFKLRCDADVNTVGDYTIFVDYDETAPVFANYEVTTVTGTLHVVEQEKPTDDGNGDGSSGGDATTPSGNASDGMNGGNGGGDSTGTGGGSHQTTITVSGSDDKADGVDDAVAGNDGEIVSTGVAAVMPTVAGISSLVAAAGAVIARRIGKH